MSSGKDGWEHAWTDAERRDKKLFEMMGGVKSGGI